MARPKRDPDPEDIDPETGEKLPGSAQPREDRCGAHLRYHFDDPNDVRKDRFCTQPKGWKTPHPGYGACKSHGGTTTTHLKKAADEMTKDIVAKRMDEMGKPVAGNLRPLVVEMYDLVAEVLQFKEVAREQVSILQTIEYEDRQGVERVKPIIELYERAIDRAKAFLVDAHRMNMTEQIARMEKDQIFMLVGMVVDVLEDPALDLTDEQIDLAKTLFKIKFNTEGRKLRPRELPDDEELEIFDAEVLDEEGDSDGQD